jgi:hypothetical protein
LRNFKNKDPDYRKKEADAELRELKLQEKKQEVIPIEKLNRDLTEVLTVFVRELDSIPTSLANRLFEMETCQQISIILEKYVYDIRINICDSLKKLFQ